ncbi:uncharacterized protein BO88DRAFT_405265 [Aspergillus vadensis CBS 113365]|uniref:Uncharacterized protein n=1 Tax=Aspergillus vadensis (strain CBS 113365 / IMI 142717 / IBT 24658) TaxID=1448311 RepID=A0A319B9A8_ASPVC|nr:hypothetical protein BO88DRAFT_405265 [Aspergillus vadensis CBS 113365]PYH68959.1 hypothetical protein BO88DRAFT_405265 [Aspergillus vadensis CBS 113365]
MEGAPTPLIRRGCSLPRLGIDTHPLPFPPTVATFWSPKPDYSTLRLGGKSSLPWELTLLLLLLATNLMGPVKLQSVVASDPLPHAILRYSVPALRSTPDSPFLPPSLPA